MNKYIKYKKPYITRKLKDLITSTYDSKKGPVRNRMFLKAVYLTYNAKNSSNPTLIPVFESIKKCSKDRIKYNNEQNIILDMDGYFESNINNKKEVSKDE